MMCGAFTVHEKTGKWTDTDRKERETGREIECWRNEQTSKTYRRPDFYQATPVTDRNTAQTTKTTFETKQQK